MSTVDARNLAILTVSNPAEAARRILANCPGRDVLWLAFSLVVVLNAMLQTGSSLLFPAFDPNVQVQFDPAWQVLVTSAGALLLSIVVFFFVGRLFGGQGSFNQVMALIVWLQFLQIVAQAGIFVLALVMPGLLRPLILAVTLFSLYITLHFLNQAHKFGSLGKSFLVVLAAGVAAIPFVLLLIPAGPE